MINFLEKMSTLLLDKGPSDEEVFKEMIQQKKKALSSVGNLLLKSELRVFQKGQMKLYPLQTWICPEGVLVKIDLENPFYLLRKGQKIYRWIEGYRPLEIPPQYWLTPLEGTQLVPDDFLHAGSDLFLYSINVIGEDDVDGKNCTKMIFHPNHSQEGFWNKMVAWVDLKEKKLYQVSFFDSNLNEKRTMKVLSFIDFNGETLINGARFIPANGKNDFCELHVICAEKLDSRESLPFPAAELLHNCGKTAGPGSLIAKP